MDTKEICEIIVTLKQSVDRIVNESVKWQNEYDTRIAELQAKIEDHTRWLELLDASAHDH